MCAVLDQCHLNRSNEKLMIKMLTIKQIIIQIRSEDWFITLDLKDAYFHVSIFPDVPEQEVPKICFWGQSIPISGSSFQPSIFTHHFDHMRRCYSGSSATLGHLGIKLY